MSTTQRTQSSAFFDPTGMSSYWGLQGPMWQGLTQDMTDPLSSINMPMQFAQGSQNIFGQSPTSMMARNMTQRGIPPSSPLFRQVLMQGSYATRGRQAGLMNNLFLQAGNIGSRAGQLASMYQPLQTGQTSVSGYSGPGTWV